MRTCTLRVRCNSHYALAPLRCLLLRDASPRSAAIFMYLVAGKHLDHVRLSARIRSCLYIDWVLRCIMHTVYYLTYHNFIRAIIKGHYYCSYSDPMESLPGHEVSSVIQGVGLWELMDWGSWDSLRAEYPSPTNLDLLNYSRVI